MAHNGTNIANQQIHQISVIGASRARMVSRRAHSMARDGYGRCHRAVPRFGAAAGCLASLLGEQDGLAAR